mmetsp:Transcript_33853/g.81429  ORF Transcript_33853/g.81429 Transcript_33853/m.81429 type:complete len:346 (-) Transcript_33853:195-1232(-)
MKSWIKYIPILFCCNSNNTNNRININYYSPTMTLLTTGNSNSKIKANGDGGPHNGDNDKSTSSSITETYEKLADKLRSKLDDMNGHSSTSTPKQYWVCIAGGPGSGKSVSAEAVADLLNKDKRSGSGNDDIAVVVPADGWHYPQKKLKDLFGDDAMKRRGAPWTFDAEKSYHDLKKAKEDGHAKLPIYDRERSDPVENAVELKSTTRIVLVEGLYLLMPQVDDKNAQVLGCKEEDDGGNGEKILTSSGRTVVDVDIDCEDKLRILSWWGRHKELFDEGWFIKAPSRDEQIDRLIQRNKKTWNEEKEKMWGLWPEGARKRVEVNDIRQMDLIAPSEENADEVIITR